MVGLRVRFREMGQFGSLLVGFALDPGEDESSNTLHRRSKSKLSKCKKMLIHRLNH